MVSPDGRRLLRAEHDVGVHLAQRGHLSPRVGDADARELRGRQVAAEVHLAGAQPAGDLHRPRRRRVDRRARLGVGGVGHPAAVDQERQAVGLIGVSTSKPTVWSSVRLRTSRSVPAAYVPVRETRVHCRSAGIGALDEGGREGDGCGAVVVGDGLDLGALLDVAVPLPPAEVEAGDPEEDRDEGPEQPAPRQPESKHSSTVPGLRGGPGTGPSLTCGYVKAPPASHGWGSRRVPSDGGRRRPSRLRLVGLPSGARSRPAAGPPTSNRATATQITGCLMEDACVAHRRRTDC